VGGACAFAAKGRIRVFSIKDTSNIIKLGGVVGDGGRGGEGDGGRLGREWGVWGEVRGGRLERGCLPT